MSDRTPTPTVDIAPAQAERYMAVVDLGDHLVECYVCRRASPKPPKDWRLLGLEEGACGVGQRLSRAVRIRVQ